MLAWRMQPEGRGSLLSKCAVLRKPLEDLAILNLEVPPLEHGQVLVEIAYAGICRSQIMEVDGLRGPDKYLPHLLGHEASGIVLETGSGVSKVKQGEKVILSWIRGDGLNAPGPKYKFKNEIINSGQIATFGTVVIVSENCVFKISEDTDLVMASLFGCAIPTGAGMALKELPNNLTESSVIVFGLGAIGMSALFALLSKKPRLVIVVDRDEAKLKFATSLGSVKTINSATENVKSQILNFNNGDLCDFAIDATGSTEGIMEAFSSVRKFGGLCVFASHPKSGQMLKLDPFDLISGRNIRGSWGGAMNLDSDLSQLLEMFLNNTALSEMFTSSIYELDDVNQAISDLRSNSVLRPILRMSKDF
jgi:S-(hydroxymethyl)glutathione dehydrogenase/alcohol dehydrogenase